MKELRDEIKIVLRNIKERSLHSRQKYLSSVNQMNADKDNDRGKIGCSNLAHAGAAMGSDKFKILKGKIPNIGIISALIRFFKGLFLNYFLNYFVLPEQRS